MKIAYILILLSSTSLFSQFNCNEFLRQGDTLQYKACKLVEESEGKYSQFDKRYHKLMNEALQVCPHFAYPYREIGAPYIKSGNFLEWKKNMDKAVKYDPKGYLGVRASLKYKFFADYEGAIEDIDSLSTIISYDIGYTSNGTYHLNVVKGLCLKALENIDEAIKIIAKQSEIEGDFGMYNYIHLGVLYMEKGDYENALLSFRKQLKHNNISENQYYTAICYKELKDLKKTEIHLNEALKLYQSERKMLDPYNELFDQIYMYHIKRELDLIQKNTK